MVELFGSKEKTKPKDSRLTRRWVLGIASVFIIAALVAVGCSFSPNNNGAPASSASPTFTHPPASVIQASAPTPILTPSAALTPLPSPSVVTTTASPSPSPIPTTTSTQPPAPTAIYTPVATPFMPSGLLTDYFNYVLGLINADRSKANTAGVNPVILNYNSAAQQHAEDMLKNKYVAHWGTDGLKPYMRYTLQDGLNYEEENSAYYASIAAIDVRQQLAALENEMMTNDAASNWAHRDNILNTWHKKVNLGIAYDNNSVALVEQFEGDYVEFYQPPTIAGNILTLSGKFTQPGLVLNNAAVAYDPIPQPLTGDQLMNGPYHSYGFGKILGQVFPLLPPGYNYNAMPPGSILATGGFADQSGAFSVEADISLLLASGSGVYTICLIPTMSTGARNLTNYSIFIK